MNSLAELFNTFFPGKEFAGPVPTSDGRLLFPVHMNGGLEHDINELSSGEKEVLFGYLRLYNASPRNSVLLFDEPELHLNPRLARGLPQFYHKHIGIALNNQIWLVTHSDTLLREALTNTDFSVFHLQIPGVAAEGENQISPIDASGELDRAIINLVGDLATFTPRAKVVIFEGGGDTESDLYMVNTLFPEFQNKVNAISGGAKGRVRTLHSVLIKAHESGALPQTFFSVVDRDSDEPTTQGIAEALSWDVYHIENYLLEPQFIIAALRDALGPLVTLTDEQEVLTLLRECASDTLHSLVRHHLEKEVNHRLVSCIKTRTDPNQLSVAPMLSQVIENSKQRLVDEVEQRLTLDYLEKQEKEIRTTYEKDLTGDNWRSSFRGRDILRRFVGKHGDGVSYEMLLNLIIAKMRDESYQPAGMKAVIDQILSG